MTFHHNVIKNLFHISTNIPAFFPVCWLARGPRAISLPPVIASAISSNVFINCKSWRSSATALLGKQGLFSSLRKSKSVTTCSSIFCLLTGSAEMSPLDFTATVKKSLECFLTWLQLLRLSFFLFCFFKSLRTTWIRSALVKWRSPFCTCLFINKLNKAATFSSQKGRTTYDCHLLECIIHI